MPETKKKRPLAMWAVGGALALALGAAAVLTTAPEASAQDTTTIPAGEDAPEAPEQPTTPEGADDGTDTEEWGRRGPRSGSDDPGCADHDGGTTDEGSTGEESSNNI